MPHLRLLLLLVGLPLTAGLSHASEINPPIGPHIHLKPSDFAESASFTTEERLVLTPYFYWYDVYSGAHIVNPDGSDALTTHPPTLTGFSYLSRAWHRQQMLDMMDAGIDVLLPVYWGEPSDRLPDRPVAAQAWSYAGLLPLVQARDELLAEGKDPPRIGLFYDTSTLEWNAAGQQIDLTTDHGRQWFYESIRDFFSLIPPRHWAMIDHRPILFLYSSSFASRHDQSCILHLQQAFAVDFAGRTPYLVREISWKVLSDQVYAWGGALGLKNPGVASLGPGYDHSAVPDRTPLVVDREDGAFFERNWIRFLRNPSRLVMIETWNEFHEGTDIAASREYGRQYIELNRHYVDLFKAGIRPPRPRGAYSDFKTVRIGLSATNESHGLFQFDHPDGITEPTLLAGRECRAVVPTQYQGRYVYLRIDDSYKWADSMLVDVAVDYFDHPAGSFRIEYDGSDPHAPFQGAYTASLQTVTLTGTAQWKTAHFRLPSARFLNSQNGGADLRIATGTHPLHISTVRLSRLGLPVEAGALLQGWQDDFRQGLEAHWRTAHSEPTAFLANKGLLAIHALQAPAARALVSSVPDSAAVELLARIRIVAAPTPGQQGGLILSASTDSETGVHLQFETGTQGNPELVLGSRLVPRGHATGFAWETNRWYWARFLHQPESVRGYPDLWARVWPADGETAEPIVWTVHWDYDPDQPARHGLPGFIAGTAIGGILECDYILIQADPLPAITGLLPGLKPERPRLTAVGYSKHTGFRLRLQASEAPWILQSSTNLRTWEDLASLPPAASPVDWMDPAQTPPAPYRFYRVRDMR
jgi:hypothetical protein